MKTTIYLVRHGQSSANVQTRFCGHSDWPLSDLGIKQAQAVASYLSDKHIDYFYASDLTRAFDTAVAIAQKHGQTVIKNKMLREINGGDFEGRTIAEARKLFPIERGIWESNIGFAICPNGESVKDAGLRFYNELVRLCKLHQGKVLLIGAHALVIRAFCARVQSDDLNFVQTLPFPDNASVTTVTYNGEKFILEKYSENSYLKGL